MEDEIRVLNGYIGVCLHPDCEYVTTDLPVKSLVRSFMVRHFEDTGHEDWERIG